MPDYIPNYTKQELCNHVYAAVQNARQPLTRLEICLAIGRKKSPHIIAMIESLAADGWFIKSQQLDKHGRPAWFYSLNLNGNPDSACR